MLKIIIRLRLKGLHWMRMNKEYTIWQKKILNYILDKYERSKAYKEGIDVANIASFKPNAVFKDYYDNSTSVAAVDDFNAEMAELECEGLIILKRDGQGYEIKSIKANISCLSRYYEILGRNEKSDIQKKQLLTLRGITSASEISSKFVQEQIERIELKRNPTYSCEDVKTICMLCDYILSNEKDILERELSISLFGNSKTFEKEYRSKVCTILRKFGSYDELFTENESATMIEHIILEEHKIYANPKYIYFKGNATFTFESGNKAVSVAEASTAFLSDAVEKIVSVSINANTIMTVENLTSFNRLQDEDVFFIYLEGYHGTLHTRFLRKIFKGNDNKKWMHFGDIDPDGFYILEHLNKATRISFEPFLMSLDILEKYKGYSKTLEPNDIKKASSLLSNYKYTDVIKYMVDYDCKLEQEIISLDYFRTKQLNHIIVDK